MSDSNIFELKERAKWAKDVTEKKSAIKELTSHGERAIPALDEIQTITAYEDIRAACMEAIKAIKGKGGAQDQKKEDQTVKAK